VDGSVDGFQVAEAEVQELTALNREFLTAAMKEGQIGETSNTPGSPLGESAKHFSLTLISNGLNEFSV
jgi:hypothetical protein